jgi:hypothetical protein
VPGVSGAARLDLASRLPARASIMVGFSGFPDNELTCPARLRFEIFRSLQSGLPNPETTGALSLLPVPGGKMEQRVAAGRTALFVPWWRQRPKIADHAPLLAGKAMIAALPTQRDNLKH